MLNTLAELPAEPIGAGLDGRPRRGHARILAVSLAYGAAAALIIAVSPLQLVGAPQNGASAKTAPPSFEVVSIRRCTEADLRAIDEAAARSGREGGPARNTGDAGTLRLQCSPVQRLIATAYLMFANGEAHSLGFGNGAAVQGGPSWIETEKYTINAKAASPQSMATMIGPMMQSLLEDRFKLKVHLGNKTVQAYSLAPGQRGPKLQLTKGCPADLQPALPLAPGQPCRYQRFTETGTDVYGWTIANLGELLGSQLGRTVIDKTGISGAYDFHLDLPAPPPPDKVGQNNLGPSDPLGDIEDSLKKLGLKLGTASSTTEFVVVDHIEPPTEN